MKTTLESSLRLVPLPRHTKMGLGQCAIPRRQLRVHSGDAVRLPLKTLAGELGLRVRADAALPAHAAIIGVAELPVAPEHVQGYAIRITETGIALIGYDAQGLVWGLQTLRQILAQAPKPLCLEIMDWPEYRIRYQHDDVSRKQVSTNEDFRRIIRNLAAFKFSHYTPYIEDMVKIPGIPLMGEGRGAFTTEELRALSEEGDRWGVEVFPTISLSGHQENLMSLPRYRPLGAKTWQPPSAFDPKQPAVREHLLKVMDAICPLFSSPLFHMCFDEVIGLDADGFAEHVNWCATELVKRGKTPLIWIDMLYNHFGCDLLKRLHPAVIPVSWEYRASGGKARETLPEVLKYRDQAWILSGYANCQNYLHRPLAPEHLEQWSNWRKVADPARVSGFGCSQWGDGGYENLRDCCWPLFAAFAEQGWSGDTGEPATVEERFQTVFHGHPLPELTQVRRVVSDGLSISSGEAWRLHRIPPQGWIRLAKAGKIPTPAQLSGDIRRLAEASRLLARCRKLARHERAHLDHYQIAIDRVASVVDRALAARKPAHIPKALVSLARARASYRALWLAQNRPENIEVSLAVYDVQAASWKSLAKPVTEGTKPGWHPLNLDRSLNTCFLDISGIPIGGTVVGGVPFRFAPVNRTHAEIAPGKTLSLTLPVVPIRDFHMVITQPRDGEEIRPGARLRLTRRGHVVYEEELLTIRNLCDWWAPLGEQMWAGGGFAYVDPIRVKYLMKPNEYYGLTCISRFPWPAAPVADRLELTCLGNKPLQLFAITLEEALR